MAGWSGFSDDDLRKMRQANMAVSNSSKPGLKSTKQSTPTRTKVIKDIGPQRGDTFSDRANPDNSKLVQETAKITSDMTANKKENNENNIDKVNKNNVAQHIDKSSTNKEIVESALPSVSDLNGVKELDENEALSFERNSVQKFQIQQKVIEEANKHKRALLAKAIEDRRKQAKAEAEKLMKVQQELNHLDSLLTADVSIIRDKIEIASLEYNDAQKRYERAEKEFVAAKMDLFSKGEVKEQLTQHLYTIIHQNEVRKAKKLVELMEKLAMEVTPEEMELTIPAIPQLTNFTAVATLHGPQPVRSNNTSTKPGSLDVANVSTQEMNNPGTFSKEAESVRDLPPPVAPAPVKVETLANQGGCDQVTTSTAELSSENISSSILPNAAHDVDKKTSLLASEESVVEFSKHQANVLEHSPENKVLDKGSKEDEVIGKNCQENEVLEKDINSQNSLPSSTASSGRGWTHPFT